jgi:hypothetical protein
VGDSLTTHAIADFRNKPHAAAAKVLEMKRSDLLICGSGLETIRAVHSIAKIINQALDYDDSQSRGTNQIQLDPSNFGPFASARRASPRPITELTNGLSSKPCI